MAGEQTEAISQGLRDWLDAEASERNVDQSELLERAVRGYRHLDRDGTDRSPDLDDLETRIESLETDLDEKIADVRNRVVQVKRETDEKASVEHTHEPLRADLETATASVRDLRETVERLDQQVDRGFENYEEILEHLADSSEELESNLDTLADALVSLRSRVTHLEAAQTRRDAVEDLRHEAQADGKRRADCGSCGATVYLGLLDAPECPHCQVPFDGYEPAQSFFRSAKLTASDPPALEEGDTDAGGNTRE